MAHLKYSIEDNFAEIVLTNPPQNRLSPEMLEELRDALKAVGSSGARALLLSAEGNDFSFGGDIVPWVDMDVRSLRTLFEDYMHTFNMFERLSIPTVAAVQGLCFGGGLELAVRADVIWAGETSRFGHPEQSLGIVTLLGGTYRVAERAGRSKAIEWALTSEQVPASVMAQFGVVNKVVPDITLKSEAEAFARKLAAGPTRAHAAHKALLRIWATSGVATADEAMFDIALPLFESDDVKLALPTSVELFKAGKPRTPFDFRGR
ncbi:enoyl-CoA hydratase/isomerase family protein [Agrobacterium tumefaciens]|uniref:Enoyl-CoA hydratase/isomerase family protein n=1 Tax=Agrobacterium tumefaciens TaxID=358 RepID=A0AA44F4T6_AGRTU|nr:enoyl-CoA hydratase/isomerase family protein [Agrobacterium tumefaciens]NSL21314.1 enoyl-CoA hydratase/isomerase family protein [Agrobacterium tumefaciens]NTB83886.1 enoyl-CoA hydratase/isomerase family protein [Agrobacterium tumefaciens]NTC20645.1 enoyl-CoA hydratase/isomerase family protein [Agrobacterium tumefaciens]NTC29357.1 enoyl-CoA hydratase/isomerase family protein [Agrobacterium tumefaciens]NTC57853.1 enoyl-CoA hydratase/isomerase family protein [Agrobacterium tumefaciens]